MSDSPFPQTYVDNPTFRVSTMWINQDKSPTNNETHIYEMAIDKLVTFVPHSSSDLKKP